MEIFNDKHYNYKVSKEDILNAKNDWKAKFPMGINWDFVLETVGHYFNHLSELTYSKFISWQGFLNYLKEIENSIPIYDYYHGEADVHNFWLRRILFIFGRSYLEETTVKNSKVGHELKLKFRDNPTNPNDTCHPGPGNDRADLESELDGERYEVKHTTNFDYKNIHEGHFVIAYQEDGGCLLYDKNLAKLNAKGNLVGGLVIGWYIDEQDAPGVRSLFANRGIPAYLYNITDEKKLEEAFNFISID